MTLHEAINIRTSRRTYIDAALDENQIEKLQKLIDEYNKIGGFRIELITNNGEAFKGFTRSYGMLSGVSHYLGFIADKNDPFADEKIGYYGQLLVLHATTLELGTCWVGGTFSKAKTPFKLTLKERLACLITVGKVETTPTGKEAFIYKLTHRKTKSASEMMMTTDTNTPSWFLQGMEAVVKAPSAMNKQPVIIHYDKDIVSANIKKARYLVDFDLGIAKLHFEIGAGGGTWEWGNGGKFKKAVEELIK